MPLRDASELLWPAVQETIYSLELGSGDAATVKLAQRYAQIIDQAPDAKQASVIRWLGPELLRCLDALGANPAARAAIAKGVTKTSDAKPQSQLDKLRAARTKGRSA